jgi:hypothetical protein
MNPAFKVSKLDAAKRQLETVIRLYFSNAEPVSIHTLTAAAYKILQDLTKHKGAEPMIIKGQLLDYVKPEHRRDTKRKINEAENFFKHADRDPEATFTFHPDSTELLIVDACAQYTKLAGEEPPLFKIYRCWAAANHPKLFLPRSGEFNEKLKATAPALVQMGRAQFFEAMLPVAMRIPS